MVHCTEGVAGAGQAAAGAVGAVVEVPFLAVLALQAAVTCQTRALTGAVVTLVWIQDPLTITAAVTEAL